MGETDLVDFCTIHSAITWAYSLTQPRTGPCNADGVAGFLFSLLCYALPLFRSLLFVAFPPRSRSPLGSGVGSLRPLFPLPSKLRCADEPFRALSSAKPLTALPFHAFVCAGFSFFPFHLFSRRACMHAFSK